LPILLTVFNEDIETGVGEDEETETGAGETATELEGEYEDSLDSQLLLLPLFIDVLKYITKPTISKITIIAITAPYPLVKLD